MTGKSDLVIGIYPLQVRACDTDEYTTTGCAWGVGSVARSWWPTRQYALKVVCLALLLAAGCNKGSDTNELPRGQVAIAGQTFRVEVAADQQSRRRGLMYRTELGEYEGMLFVFDRPGIQRFWMKNTYIPLDILFIADDLTVANVETMVPTSLESVASTIAVRYALEVPAGTASRLNITSGTVVEFGEVLLKYLPEPDDT